jgi:hypothetical protein
MDSQRDLDQASLKDLRLSRRTFNAIHRSGVFAVGELKEIFQNNRLERIPFIGQKSIDEVSNALNEFLSIEILNLHASTRGALIKNGIETIGDLRFVTEVHWELP